MVFPSINALRAFDAAARLGSFKAAANELGVGATAVSHQIRGLEAQLGFALFERRARHIVLTEAGERLALSTTRAFRDLEDALAELRDEGATLTVSTTPAFAALWLAPRLFAFEARYPELRMRVDSSTDRVDLERDRRVDVVIRYGAPAAAAAQHLVFQERIGAYAAPALVDRLENPLEAPLIATQWRNPALCEMGWSAWMEAAGLPRPEAVRRFDQEHHVAQAGLAGQGVILISDLLVAELVQRGWLRAVRPEIGLPGLSYAVLTRPGRPETRKIDRFVAWLKEALSSAVRDPSA